MIHVSFPEPNHTSVKKEVGRLGKLEEKRPEIRDQRSGSGTDEIITFLITKNGF